MAARHVPFGISHYTAIPSNFEPDSEEDDEDS